MTVTEFNWIAREDRMSYIKLRLLETYSNEGIRLTKGLLLQAYRRYGITGKRKDRKGFWCLYRNDDIQVQMKVPMNLLAIEYEDEKRLPYTEIRRRKRVKLQSRKHRKYGTRKLMGKRFLASGGRRQGLFARTVDAGRLLYTFQCDAEEKRPFVATLFGHRGNQPDAYYLIGRLIATGETVKEPFTVQLRDDGYEVQIPPLRIESYRVYEDPTVDMIPFMQIDLPIITDEASWKEHMERRG